MPVLINFKICDNAKECSGIAVCPTGALSWDPKKKTIVTHNKECIACTKCVGQCPVGAIKVAKTKAEFQMLKKEIDDDLRKVSDLFIDRYGAQPVTDSFLIDKLTPGILESARKTVIEVFNDDSIKCLLKSVPIKELLSEYDVNYLKMSVNDQFLEEYKVKQLPALLFFDEQELIGKFEGYLGLNKKEELKEKIKGVLG